MNQNEIKLIEELVQLNQTLIELSKDKILELDELYDFIDNSEQILKNISNSELWDKIKIIGPYDR